MIRGWLLDHERLKSAGFRAAFLAGLSAAVWMMLQSTGTPQHDDEIKHFLISRDVWSDPKVALSLWGRCLNTLIYAVPAAFGLEAVRYLSLGL